MASSRSGNTNGQQGGGDQHHQELDEEESLGHDSSTAMSLDESSIALNATGIQSVDVSTSFAARGSRKSNSAFATSAAAPPNFSPLADSMSMSGIDTPMTLQSAKGNVNNNNDSETTLMMNGTSKNNSMPMNGNSNNNGAAKSVAMGKKKKPLNINPPNYSSNDGKTPQKLAPSSSSLSGDWNNCNSWNIQNARLQLRRASRECNRRGLKLASRWASEQLMGLAVVPQNDNNQTTTTNSMMMLDNNNESLLVLPPEECCQPNDLELYAMSLFDLGEYSRAAHILSIPASLAHNTATSPSSDGSLGQINPPRKNLTPLGIYLRAFSLYLEGERRKEEQVTELRDPLERTSLHNSNLPRLEAELRRANSLGNLDAFGLYVYGIVLKGLRGTRHAPTLNPAKNSATIADKTEQTEGDAAHRILVRSILAYPFNWSAWLDLGELCVDDPSIDTEVEELLLPIADHWMYHFFCVHVFIENKANENAIAIIEKLANGNGNTTLVDEEEVEEDGDIDNAAVSQLSGFFVQSAYLQSQLAMAYYDVRDYDSAHEHFLALSEREPYRLDHMDAFSNVLYVKDQKVALSHLAHRAVTVDKYRPETCIIVGNYYSSKGRHEKAVQYFQRALKLDRTYLSAWTLLGHEYIEMKNTAAAIEAYRRAVDISDREYRAWYGLGQTYEIMNMLLHALFYFRKAASLHPHDARMWCAIGGCLLGLDRRTDAEKSYERAVSLGDGEGIATRKLAELYREDGDEEKAAKCYLRHLELRYQSQLPGSFSGASADTSPEAFEAVVKNVRVDEPEAEALLYLAYYYRDNLEYDQAILCATRLEDYPGPEKEQAKGLLRDIRSRMDQKKKSKASSSLSPATPAMALRSGRNLSLDSRSAANAESSFEFSP